MNFLDFRSRMFPLACFNVNQVYAWQPDFNRNNLVRWTSQRLIIRLRQGYYTFPEYLSQADYPYYFANRIYRPSYVSPPYGAGLLRDDSGGCDTYHQRYLSEDCFLLESCRNFFLPVRKGRHDVRILQQKDGRRPLHIICQSGKGPD